MPQIPAITERVPAMADLAEKEIFGSAAVLIPAWKPELVLLPLVEELLTAGFCRVVCVDDGSGNAYASLFEALAKHPRVVVLRHAVNMGKGRALKTGMNHIANELPGCSRLITVDADGQHTVKDVLRVLVASRQAAAETGQGSRFTLGVRSFSGTVPWRSRLGNTLTRSLFALLTGFRIRDTQTGLRCFQRELLPTLLRLEGERYEYEMTVLTHLCRIGMRPLEVPIATVYLSGNRGSHFQPVQDSVRIYSALARAVRY